MSLLAGMSFSFVVGLSGGYDGVSMGCHDDDRIYPGLLTLSVGVGRTELKMTWDKVTDQIRIVQ
jgi:hypothetical protein